MALTPDQLQPYFNLNDLLVAQHLGNGRVRAAHRGHPTWFQQLEEIPTVPEFHMAAGFPFLEVFLPDALLWWSQRETGLCRSGIWEAKTHLKKTMLLEANAGFVDGVELLLIGPSIRNMEERQQILQKVRNLHLDHEALEKAQRALAISEERGRAILTAIPDAYLLFDASGLVTDHNLTGFPQVAQIGELRLDVVLGAEIARLFLARAMDENISGEARNFEYERQTGSVMRNFEVRLVTLAGGAFLSVVRDITDRKEFERRQQEFLSVASHELRTPLTAISGSLGLMKTLLGKNPPGRLGNLIDIAMQSGDRLIRLVNDLLDVQRIEMENRKFETRPTKLKQLVERVVCETTMFAEKFGIRLETENDGSEPMVTVDADAIHQVLTNLISNAAKFSPQGEVVIVSFKLEAPYAVVEVTDRGPGIQPEYRDRVFAKFSRIPNPNTPRIKGTGLGLSISKAIVERHNGRIGFLTEAGKGSTFFIKLIAH